MRIVLLSGDRGAGKTTALARFADAARDAGLRPGGVLQPGVFAADGSKSGSTWLDPASGASGEFGSNARELGGPSWMAWSFSVAGLEAANRAVLDALGRGADPVLVDEIGPLELRAGSGLSPALRALEAGAGARAGTDLESPKGTDPESSKGTDLESPKVTDLESPKGTDLESPKGTDPGRPLAVVAVRSALAAELAERLKAERTIPIDPSRREAAYAELAALLAPRPSGPGRSGESEAS
ncbi:MAG: DUF2478 domain-containing protein [Spirochaetia bacterium]|nr:DUF2478 domain-containing protein [Spirochaetia bacterium]